QPAARCRHLRVDRRRHRARWSGCVTVSRRGIHPYMDILGQVGTKLFTAKTLAEVGFIRPMRPDKLLRVGVNLVRWGPTPAAGYATSSVLHPDELAIIDELGSLTFAEVQRRTNGLANALGEHGIEEGDNVAILCRNHRGFIDIT